MIWTNMLTQLLKSSKYIIFLLSKYVIFEQRIIYNKATEEQDSNSLIERSSNILIKAHKREHVFLLKHMNINQLTCEWNINNT